MGFAGLYPPQRLRDRRGPDTLWPPQFSGYGVDALVQQPRASTYLGSARSAVR